MVPADDPFRLQLVQSTSNGGQRTIKARSERSQVGVFVLANIPGDEIRTLFVSHGPFATESARLDANAQTPSSRLQTFEQFQVAGHLRRGVERVSGKGACFCCANLPDLMWLLREHLDLLAEARSVTSRNLPARSSWDERFADTLCGIRHGRKSVSLRFDQEV